MTTDLDQLALDITRNTALFSRTVGRLSNQKYSAIVWRVLAELEITGETRTGWLAERHHVAQPSMTALLNRVANEGWIDRAPCPDDKRATLITITPAGREALLGYRNAAAATIHPLLQELSDDERATLASASELLRRLSDQASQRRATSHPKES